MSENTKRNVRDASIPITVLAGFPVTYIGLAIMSGGIGNANAILAASIICTLGIGAIFWIIVSFIVGLIVMGIVHVIIGPITDPKDVLKKERLSDELKPAYEYVRTAKKAGMNEIDVSKALLQNGWTHEQVKQAVSAGK